ncbi:GNAT family N-acetyltransferase [Flavobacterium sp. ZS1P14]|uniref:GNAT family N-acetyltransferase n=1 Tax=Flavobacterium sp. ZS1P14 TaxID=3401729 RepID=UPI003AAA8E0D
MKDQKIGLLKIAAHQNSIEIIQVQIEPHHQGKGIAHKIIQSIIEKLSGEKTAVTLSVLKENRAKKLYDTIGFKVISENNESFVMKYEKT